MIRILGFIFLALILEIPILMGDYFLSTGFLSSFLKNQSLQIMGAFLGLNLASSTFLVGYLTKIEVEKNKSIFKNTKNEIKENIYLMIIVFYLQLLVLVVVPEVSLVNVNWVQWLVSIGKSLSLFLFIMYLFTLYEMTSALFSLDKFINPRGK